MFIECTVEKKLYSIRGTRSYDILAPPPMRRTASSQKGPGFDLKEHGRFVFG
jgi:hypothetical protein